MGTWGPGLFSDDVACDVRGDYKDLIGDGVSEPEATETMLKNGKKASLILMTLQCFGLRLPQRNGV